MVHLAARERRIDAEVTPEAVERGDARQEPRLEALAAGAPDRLVARVDEDARVAVERGADGAPGPERGQDLLDHRLVRVESRLPDAVEVVQGAGTRVELREHTRRNRVARRGKGPPRLTPRPRAPPASGARRSRFPCRRRSARPSASRRAARDYCQTVGGCQTMRPNSAGTQRGCESRRDSWSRSRSASRGVETLSHHRRAPHLWRMPSCPCHRPDPWPLWPDSRRLSWLFPEAVARGSVLPCPLPSRWQRDPTPRRDRVNQHGRPSSRPCTHVSLPGSARAPPVSRRRRASGELGTSSCACGTPYRFASTEPSAVIFICPKPGSSPIRLRKSSASFASVQTRAASPPYSETTVRLSSCTRPAIEPGKRWIAGFSRNAASSCSGIEPGDRLGVQRSEPLLHLQRAREGHGHRHLLVEREADQQRQRLLGEQPVGLVVPGEVEPVRAHCA